MDTSKLLHAAKITAQTGNVAFIAWILFNGLDSGWKGTPAEVVSFISLILLLVLNSWLILRSHAGNK